MQVCKSGQTTAKRCVVVCDVHVSGAFMMKYLSNLCHILIISTLPYSSSWVFTLRRISYILLKLFTNLGSMPNSFLRLILINFIYLFIDCINNMARNATS